MGEWDNRRKGTRGRVTETSRPAGQKIHDSDREAGVSRGLVAGKLRMGTNRGMN